ncbi:hypothetical protein LTR91_008811 [Friedmanniomyces endolithicus]|uniref:Ubiquitin-like protease family profile domain-containing protein n=1 Tax=Friedmanniomyces endolithicus TaxID=329885 RepID=A0AAN6QUA3_9PEZI|nr:hypothetical protein LTR57_000258 [Friedmanniomyces endolithicus]KAK0990869.1 hypothetical protein LTR91_008811 [Friedmanniomyces endolithicus]KAK1010052.1 hypothetical protein LTS01_001724 [Friedmanniomyces endolithicus]KAK1043816.1 hypothetical protein LTS16_007658 [Friedmanniomyces endolithicus]
MPTFAGIGSYLVELALGKTSHGEDTEEASQSNAAASGSIKPTSTKLPRSLERSRGSSSKVSQRESDVDEIEEVDGLPGRRGGVKRGREQEDGLDLPSAKRKAWSMEGERRLVGRDGVIPTEKMVGRPTYEGKNAVPFKGTNGRSVGRGFRPVDTLNGHHVSPAPRNRIDTPRRGMVSVNGHVVRPLETRTATDRSPMSSNVGSNVQRESYRNLNPTYARADGSSIGTSSKKQKTEHLGSTNGVKSDPVDLTEPDDDEAFITAKVHRFVGSAAQSTSSHRSSPRHSSPAPPPQRPRPAVESTGRAHPFENADRCYKDQKPKTRKQRHGSPGSQSSSRAPSVMILAPVNGASPRQSGNRAAPVTSGESERGGVQPRSKGARERRISQTAPMQLIHLDDSMEDLATGKVLQGSDADLTDASRLLNLHATVRGHIEKQHKAGTKPHPNSRGREMLLERGTSGWRTELGKNDRQKEQKKLDQTFVRDSPARAPANGAKVRDPMQAKATSTSARIGHAAEEAVDTTSSSVDELQSGNTLARPAPRSASPNSKHSGGVRAGTPSDLKPTRFTQSEKSRKRQQAAKEAAQQDDERISVTPYAIYTVACCTANRGGRIVYDNRTKKLDIYEGDIPVVLPGSGGIVSIGPQEAHKLVLNKDSARVYLMGGSTQVSNGRICIAFKEHQDVEWFHERLMSVTEDSIAIDNLSADKHEACFAHQSKDIQIAHDRKATIRANQHSSKIGLHHGGRAGSEEESIQYDDETTEEQPVRTGRRDAMLAAHDKASSAGPSASANNVRSHYFHPEVGVTRRSTREKKFVEVRVQTPSPERWSRLHNPKRWSKPVEYPPQGARRVTVDFGDIERLDDGQFLNDNLINFGLRKIQEDMAPELRESVHFFNSFFYTSLTTKNGRKSLNYDSVKKWTKGKDLLSTPYVVVPINIDLHWYVAIICNLDQLIRQAGDDEEEERQVEDEFAYLKKLVEDDAPEMDARPAPDKSAADGSSSPTTEHPTDHTTEMKKLSLVSSGPASPVNADVFEFNEDGVVQATSNNAARALSTQPVSRSGTVTGKAKKGGKKKFTPVPRKYSPDTPAIITLDSFGLPHTAEVRSLKEYIIREAEDKRGMLVDRDDLYGVSAKGIPQQANFCDCGVYLLAYVEQFAKDPRAFVEKVLGKAMEEEQEFAGFNPSDKRAEIRVVLLGLNETQEAARKEMKKAKSGEKKVETASAAALSATAALAETRPAEGKSAAASDLPPAVTAAGLEDTTNHKSSAAPPASSIAVEAHKASAPAKITETAASTTKSPVWNTEEGDELDVAPARPLAQVAVIGPVEPAVVHAAHNVNPTHFHDFDEEEMLDGNTDADVVSPVALTVEPPRLGKDLLAPLEDTLVQNGGKEARAATTASSSKRFGANRPLSEVEAEDDLDEQRSQQPLEMSSRLAEVADSQEEVRVVATAPKRAGTHTKFVA